MVDLMGLCSICGKPGTMFNCHLCGRIVCGSCYDNAFGICCSCKVRKQ